MEKEEKSKDIVLYDQIVAEALNKFISIDNVDFHLIVNELEAAGFAVDLYSWRDLPLLNKYLSRSNDGTLTLLPIGEGILKVVSGYSSSIPLRSYFESLDAKEFKKRKRDYIKNNRIRVLEGANVLYISEDEEDYHTLLDYGFKNVDYFGSSVKANKYFKAHPEMLEKYHIIIMEPGAIQTLHPDINVVLTEDLKMVSRRKKIDFFKLARTSEGHPLYEEISAEFIDFKLNRMWSRKEQSIEAMFDRIVESAILNDVLNKVSVEDASLPPIDDTPATVLPMPRKKSDLRIFWLRGTKEYSEKLTKELGVNVEVFDDQNNSLREVIDGHLGEYDIFLADTSYVAMLWANMKLVGIAYDFGLLATLGNEITEQCKDTGRRLVQLTTYKSNPSWTIDEDKRSLPYIIGKEIGLNTVFVGDLANPQEQLDRRTVRVPYMKDEKLDESGLRAIIESAVHLYEDKLIELGFEPLEDNGLRTIDDYEELFKARELQEEERQAKVLNSISEFDSFVSTVLDYLETRKRKKLNDPEGIRISENENGVMVKLVYNGRVLSALTFSKDKPSKNLRIFSIQTISKKGTLGSPENVGLYSLQFEELEGTPKKPDEKQMAAISSIYKKVEYSLKPINEKYKPQKKMHMEQKKNS